MKRIFPYVLVTTAGGAVMVLELVGSRLLSPYFGGTTVIWTALIGIMMGCLALGYWWGGRLADRRRDHRVLAAILAVAGVSIAAIAFSKEVVLSLIASQVSDLRVAACLGATILFGVPSFLLASVGPFVIRMEIDEVSGSGSTVGRLSAASTGGSIVGTFLAGFVLLALFGHFKILLGLACVLLATAAACAIAAPWKVAATSVLIFAIGSTAIQVLDAPRPAGSLLDVDSAYSRIQITEYSDPISGRRIRSLITDIYGEQTGIFIDGDDELPFEFQRMFRLIHHFNPEAKSMLTIGGGIGAVARDFLRLVPAGNADVIEIDPVFIELGRKYFGLKSDPRMRIFREDGRTFVARSRKSYDAVVVDAFGNGGSLPHQLATEEFVSELAARVAVRGVVVVNLASAIEGERGLLLQAEFATYAKFFETVEVFQIDPRMHPSEPQNLLLLAIHSGGREPGFASLDPEHSRYLARRWTRPIRERPTLTDDFAPVDDYYAKAVF